LSGAVSSPHFPYSQETGFSFVRALAFPLPRSAEEGKGGWWRGSTARRAGEGKANGNICGKFHGPNHEQVLLEELMKRQPFATGKKTLSAGKTRGKNLVPLVLSADCPAKCNCPAPREER
jgi:hypothetical protein